MEKCKKCAKVVSYRDNKYCQDSGHPLPIDDIDCEFEEDKALYDIQTGIEIN
jgi:hypothetical protein